MPEEKPPPAQPSPPASKPGSKPEADRGWRGARSGSAAAAAQPGSRRRVQLTLLIGLFLALASFAVAWIFFLQAAPPEPYFLTINIGECNNERYPIVPFAKQDSDRLARHFKDKRDAESKTKDLLVKELAKVSAHTGKPIVVHISALALVRENKVYLLPVDADPDDTPNWLPLEKVLEAVGRCKEPKLLILDLAHPLADPRLGVLEDRVAEQVENHLKKNPPSFFVLCSCSAGEMSLTSELLQAGVLAYYLDKGLQGEAAKWGQPGRTDDTVTVKDLCAFAQARVNHWAHINRQRPQQPILFGQANDFPLVNLQTPLQVKEIKTEARAYPKSLKDGWESLDALKPLGVSRNVNTLLELETELLRQERRWQGGADVDEARIVKATRDARVAIEKIQGPSLAPMFLETAVGQDKKDALVRLARVIQSSLAEVVVAEKKEDRDKIGEALKKKIDEQKDASYAQLVWAVTEALAQSTELHESQVRLALAVLPKPAEGNPGFVETTYLQRLGEYAERLKVSGYRWRPEAVQHLFKAMRAREAVVAALSQDPPLLRWVRLQFEDAEKARQTAEKKLLWVQPWADASDLFVKTEEMYDHARRSLVKLRSSQRELDEAEILLPGFVPLLSDWPEYDANALASWHKANDLKTKIRQSLRDETAFFVRGSRAIDTLKLDQLDKLRSDLEAPLRSLKDLLKERIELCVKRIGPEILEQVLCLRRGAGLSATERFSLNDRAIELAKKLQEKAEREEEEIKDAALPALPRPRNPWDAVKRVNVRARLAIDLFNLPLAEFSADITRLDQLDSLETHLQKALKQSAPPVVSRNDKQPPWKEFTSWLENRYRQEYEIWTAVDSKERPAISSFYRDFALRLSRLE